MDFKSDGALDTSIKNLEAFLLDSTSKNIRQYKIEWQRLLSCKCDLNIKESELFLAKEKVMHLKEIEPKNENYKNSAEKSIENLELSVLNLKRKLNNLKNEKLKVAKNCNEQEKHMREKIAFYEEMWRKRYGYKYSTDPKLKKTQRKISELDELKRKIVTLCEDEEKYEKDVFQAKCRRSEGYYDGRNKLYPFDTFVVNIAKLYVDAKIVYGGCEIFSNQIVDIDNRMKLHKSKRQAVITGQSMLHSINAIRIANDSSLAKPTVASSLNAENVPNKASGQSKSYTLQETSVSDVLMETENEPENYNKITGGKRKILKSEIEGTDDFDTSSPTWEIIKVNSKPKVAKTAASCSLPKVILSKGSAVRKWIERLKLYDRKFSTSDETNKVTTGDCKTQNKLSSNMEKEKSIEITPSQRILTKNTIIEENSKRKLAVGNKKGTYSDLKRSSNVKTSKYFRKDATAISSKICGSRMKCSSKKLSRNMEVQESGKMKLLPRSLMDIFNSTTRKCVEDLKGSNNSDLRIEGSNTIMRKNVTINQPSKVITSKYFKKNETEKIAHTLLRADDEVIKGKNILASELADENKCKMPENIISSEKPIKGNAILNRNYMHRKEFTTNGATPIDGQTTGMSPNRQVKNFEILKTKGEAIANSTLKNVNYKEEIENSPEHLQQSEINANRDNDTIQDKIEKVNVVPCNIKMGGENNDDTLESAAPVQENTESLRNEVSSQPPAYNLKDTRESAVPMEVDENCDVVMRSKYTALNSESNLGVNAVSSCDIIRDESTERIRQTQITCRSPKITETNFKTTAATLDSKLKAPFPEHPENTGETYPGGNDAKNGSFPQDPFSPGFSYAVRQMYEMNSANGRHYSTSNIPKSDERTLLSQLAFFNNALSPNSEFTKVRSPDEEKNEFLASVYENFLTDSPPMSKEKEKSMFSFGVDSPPENGSKNDFFPLFASNTGEANDDTKSEKSPFMFNFGNASQVKSPEESNGFKLLF